ncbi:glutathione reductase [Ameyamaea chiangmaiensis NBRC 103196]|uniref:Glutathione-disulfide reductase n=1 Tax=Ameyamaea chiangmaiensis TaxID=442969 RepID=A0A850PIE8_9PROT|nr:glutathione-disulfide reductase [Ameyamaea chiangmaiensis]MBS4075427.1 glutathione-disulfide reductase [Ameyamaea chiangmaiensis]NVN41582.1 glutathione-disulfide reductase [Ameyamaea chiangmaiensis]GBQ69799.1 glutathione reductase [Ameyamaea chiangmaiensis NBRC 103196]
MSAEFDLFVIGAGSGGVRCARIAASLGARVGIVEARHWGGTCVNLGCVPKKMLVQASEYRDLVDDSHGFGWDTLHGQHDWAALIAAKDKEISRLNGIYVTMLEKAGVTLFTGFARLEDARTVVIGPGELAPDASDVRVTARRIVIATGSAPVMPVIEGIEHAISSDAAFHLPQRPDRVCIVGSGYIGVEFAGIFAGLGSTVDLVYRQPKPLRGFDEDVRDMLDEAIAARGITRHAGRTPRRIDPDVRGYRVTLDDGSVIETDCVFFATGRAPKIAGLGLERTAVVLGPHGRIEVDAELQTAEPGIYAIGDVTDQYNLTPTAIAEGHHLAEALFGEGHPREWSLATTPKAVFFTPPAASVGLTEAEAAERGDVDVFVARFRPMRHTMSGRERRTLMKLVVDHESQIVVGAHIVGDDAPEMLQGIAIAVTARLTKRDFDRTVGLHPTSAEELVTMRSVTRTVARTHKD